MLQKCLDMMKAIAAGLETELGSVSACTNFMKVAIDYSQRHLDIVKKWGRFPHRNKILHRQSTEAEMTGLADGSIEGF
jgi:uncharacterized protein (DUF924 family)